MRPLSSRRTVCTLVAALTAALAVGCGATEIGDPPADTSDTAADTDGVVKDPRVRFVGLDDGDVVGGLLSVTIEVDREVGQVRGVELHLDQTRVDTVLLEPFSSTLDTTGFSDGAHVLRAVVARLDGSSVETGVAIEIDNTGPTVELTSPANDSALFAADTIEMMFGVSDLHGVSELAVTVSGIPVEVTGPPWVATFRLASLSLTEADLPIDLIIGATATDTVGRRTHQTFGLTLQSRLAYRVRTLGEVWAPPVVADSGAAWVGSLDGVLYALGDDGAVSWQVDTGAQIVTSPAELPGAGVVVSSGQRVLALEASAGGELWAWDAPATVGSSPSVADGRVFVGTYEPSVVALHATSGAPLWTFPVGDAVLSTPRVDAAGTLVFGSSDGYVYGVEAATGVERWRFQTGHAVWSPPQLTRDGDVLIGSRDGYLYRLSPAGTMRWEFDARGEIWGGAAEAADGTVYTTSTFRRLYALTPSGSLKWEIDNTSGFASSTPAVASDGTIFVASTDGVLHALSPDGEPLWSFETGGPIQGSPALSADESLVYVGSNDRYVYAIHTGLAGQGGCGMPEMVDVGGTRIMRYEASRVDATSTAAGTSVAGVCSRPGAMPWTNLTWQEAQLACQLAGMQLCPGAVWENACRGPGMSDYPYGGNHDAAACNGDGYVGGTCATGGCGALATGEASACISSLGVHDASGNVREWTLDQGLGGYVVRGGGFRDAAAQLSCADTSQVTPGGQRADDVGFRCCASL